MAWKTPNGCWLQPGDKVVFLNDVSGGYDWDHTGEVVECLPVNDDDDGEIKISWDNGSGPLTIKTRHGIEMPRTWYYPMWVEKIESINVLDRIVKELDERPS